MLHFVYAFCSTVGFSVMFNIPKRETVFAGLTGAIGWFCYELVQEYKLSIIFAAFVGALIVGILSELLAKWRKMPATLFVIPGIIPLVPGYGLYFSMLSIIENQYDEALRVGLETVMVAVVIASAIILSTVFGKIIRKPLKFEKAYKKI